MKAFSKLVLIVFVVCGISACHENHFNTNANLSLSDYDALRVEKYKFNKTKINESLGRLVKADKDTLSADYHTRQHYLGTQALLWVDRYGVRSQADSLLIYINKVGEIGFSPRHFRAEQIARDLDRMKELDFDDVNDINTVAARLDYNLTKAYLRYVGGQRYGFINPHKLFNHLDRDADDTLHTIFRQLYDVHTKELGQERYHHLLDMVVCDSVPELLHDAEPQSELYKKLKSMLPASVGFERERILVNMERCRWRQNDYPWNHDKYIVVNIPSYELIAYDKGNMMEMKVVCGSAKTKTPLLNSRIMRMDLNPQWVMPFSIVKKDIAAHAGDSAYFARNHYCVKDKATGQLVTPHHVSASAFRSGAYKCFQEGGEGNALGRIIFRFQNNFAIYLHDTSTKSTFGRDNRSASHGCIRVEKPYELAEFLLEDKDESLLEKIKYSMEVRTRVPSSEEEPAEEIKVDKSKIIHSREVSPQVPLFITYYTLYQMPDGSLRRYADVYGYDSVMARILNNFR